MALILGFGIFFIAMIALGSNKNKNVFENNNKIRINNDTSENPFEFPLSLYKHVAVKDP